MKVPVGMAIFVAAAGGDPRYARLVHRYFVSAVVWLLLGSAAGLLDAFRFTYPDLLSSASLSFGRVRPMHTGMVLWGWASLALVGLALYVVPRSCRTNLKSLKAARVSLWLWNIGLALGTIALARGGSNGGQEYREYPVALWIGSVPIPIVPLFAVAVVLLFWNFYATIRSRAVHQIYISNWFLLAAMAFVLLVITLGYVPGLHRGLGQTVVQGWYMHNAVGMWFTPLAVGMTYYALPKLLNKPIYSYALGVLGFWTHIAFYTLIGTHHYIFSPLPTTLQTAAIIFSTAMMVPVWASTGNFLLTMWGERNAISTSYSLPFLLVGVIAYGLASVQGTLQAFHQANEQWHLTQYTIGHSHLAMVGFVSFLVWGGAYGLLPRVTGREPPVETVGIHFWLSLSGLTIMVLSLCIGGNGQGGGWLDGVPFIETVRDLAPYWVWRSVGGTFMLLGHVMFAVNVWLMRPGEFVNLMAPPGGRR